MRVDQRRIAVSFGEYSHPLSLATPKLGISVPRLESRDCSFGDFPRAKSGTIRDSQAVAVENPCCASCCLPCIFIRSLNQAQVKYVFGSG